MIRLKSYSAKSHQGPYLQVNEDAVLVDYANRLAIVMDGLVERVLVMYVFNKSEIKLRIFIFVLPKIPTPLCHSITA